MDDGSRKRPPILRGTAQSGRAFPVKAPPLPVPQALSAFRKSSSFLIDLSVFF